MTNEEAIRQIKNKLEELKAIGYGEFELALETAINVLRTQVPINPIKRSDWEPALCPNCFKEISEAMGDGYYKDFTNLKVCDCGQKLDWSYFCD